MRTILEDTLVRFPTERDTPGCHVAQQSTTLYSVRLSGRLEAAWAGNLSLGLALSGFNILGGFARRSRSDRWVAEFLVTPTPAAPPPDAVDYLALSRVAHPEVHPGPVELSHFAVDGSPDQGPALFLEVRGPDRIGFLGSLLRSLAELRLSPQEMTLTTRNEEVSDRFLLRTEDAVIPSDATRRDLSRLLSELTIPREALPASF